MTEIHSTAVIHDGAEIGEGAVIGPYCVIGPNVKIKERAQLHSHVVIEGHTTIGSECDIFSFACIGSKTQDLKFKGDVTYVEIGDRTNIREYVTVNSGTNEGELTKVGSDCHIMAYCHVAHACTVGDGVIMANCATLAGDVTVEDKAILGGLSAVHQFSRVGTMCIVGGCSKISQDVPPYMMVDGNPARVRGLNSVGLKRRGVDADSQKRLKDAYRLIYRKKLSRTQAIDQIRSDIESSPEVDHLVEFIEKSERGIIK